ncbi:MAG: hypothetical protein EXR75_15060 [Myxococcales bacterium]|nr:hypothetical protein [Myxococcales bacterium]
MFPVARIHDGHVCPIHGGGPVEPPGSATVLVNQLPAVSVTDRCTCTGAADFIVTGASTVWRQQLRRRVRELPHRLPRDRGAHALVQSHRRQGPSQRRRGSCQQEDHRGRCPHERGALLRVTRPVRLNFSTDSSD